MSGRDAELRWLNKAENWGEWLRVPDDRPGDPKSIWLMKGPTGARFYSRRPDQGQVGPHHSSLVAACYWAWGNGWLWADPEYETLDLVGQLACRRWVQEGGAVTVDEWVP